MAINKVVYGNNVLVDLTNDTVSPENLQSGATAHSKSGALIRGTANMGGAAPCTVLLSPEFASQTKYNRNEFVIHNGGLYRYVRDHSADPGNWNANEVIQTTISDEVENILSGIQPKNLFDKNSLSNLIGKYFDTNNSLVVNAEIFQTEMIPVISGHKYSTSNNSFFVNWYASNGDFVGFTSSPDFNANKYVIPVQNAAYGRFMEFVSKIDSFRVWDLTINQYWIQKQIDPEDASFFEEKNLFKIDENTLIGRYYNTQNELIINSTFGQTGLIPVVSGHMYITSNTRFFILWYGQNQNYLGFTDSQIFARQGYAFAIQNAAYARFTFLVSDINSFKIHDKTDKQYVISPEWISSKSSSSGNSDIEEYKVSQFNEKKWVSFGDSITFRNTWQPKIAELLNLEHTNCGIGSTSLSGPNIWDREDLPSFWTDTRLNTVKEADPDIITILGGANDVANTITLGNSNEFSYSNPSNPAVSQGALAYDSSANYSIGDYCTKDSVRYQCNTAISGGEEWNSSHWTPVKNLDTFIGAYSYIIENLLNWKRTLAIVILGTTYGANDATGSASGLTYTQLSDASKLVAQYYGLPFVDLHSKAGFNKFTMGTGNNAVYSEDQIHPNIVGSKRITKLVLDCFVNEVTVN